MDLIVGHDYWVLLDTHLEKQIFNDCCFHNLKYMTLVNIINHGDNKKVYHFCTYLESENRTIDRIITPWMTNGLFGFAVDENVFKTPDHFLRKLVDFQYIIKIKRNYDFGFDPFMKNKIKESQERNPEIWI